MKDNIFSNARRSIGDFVFDETVVSVFPDMLERSVPGYAGLVDMIGMISAKFAEPDTGIYDLGCSLGETAFAIYANNPDFNGKIIAVDNSEPMIRELCSRIQASSVQSVVSPLLADVRDVEINNASFVAMNLTLQFIAPEDRDTVIRKIYDALRPGGAFVLSEKIAFTSPEESEMMQELFFHFKRRRGYSENEIMQKKRALENILIPETADKHIARLKKTGFSSVYQWFQNLNFISLIAVK